MNATIESDRRQLTALPGWCPPAAAPAINQSQKIDIWYKHALFLSTVWCWERPRMLPEPSAPPSGCRWRLRQRRHSLPCSWIHSIANVSGSYLEAGNVERSLRHLLQVTFAEVQHTAVGRHGQLHFHRGVGGGDRQQAAVTKVNSTSGLRRAGLLVAAGRCAMVGVPGDLWAAAWGRLRKCRVPHHAHDLRARLEREAVDRNR